MHKLILAATAIAALAALSPTTGAQAQSVYVEGGNGGARFGLHDEGWHRGWRHRGDVVVIRRHHDYGPRVYRERRYYED